MKLIGYQTVYISDAEIRSNFLGNRLPEIQLDHH